MNKGRKEGRTEGRKALLPLGTKEGREEVKDGSEGRKEGSEGRKEGKKEGSEKMKWNKGSEQRKEGR